MLLDIFNGNTPPLYGLLTLVLVLMSIAIHEFSHALAALLLGDPTAKYEGRLTLNPLAHFDMFGLLAILLTRFGWGKPVPINPANFRQPARDTAIVSFAGPLSNFVYAVVLLLAMKLITLTVSGLALFYVVDSLLIAFIVTISLGIFNLLPVWPLDGSKILSFLLPVHLRDGYTKFMSSFGIFGLILVIMPILPGGQSVFGLIMAPVMVGLQILLGAVGF